MCYKTSSLGCSSRQLKANCCSDLNDANMYKRFFITKNTVAILSLYFLLWLRGNASPPTSRKSHSTWPAMSGYRLELAIRTPPTPVTKNRKYPGKFWTGLKRPANTFQRSYKPGASSKRTSCVTPTRVHSGQRPNCCRIESMRPTILATSCRMRPPNARKKDGRTCTARIRSFPKSKILNFPERASKTPKCNPQKKPKHHSTSARKNCTTN